MIKIFFSFLKNIIKLYFLLSEDALEAAAAAMTTSRLLSPDEDEIDDEDSIDWLWLLVELLWLWWLLNKFCMSFEPAEKNKPDGLVDETAAAAAAAADDDEDGADVIVL